MVQFLKVETNFGSLKASFTLKIRSRSIFKCVRDIDDQETVQV